MFLLILFFTSSLGFGKSTTNIYPLFFSKYKPNGGIWNVNKNGSVFISGFGVSANAQLSYWSIEGTFIAIGMIGQINKNSFGFSHEQGLPFLDTSKDGATHWVETANTKISYKKKNLIFEFGKFDRHWGPGRNSILISNKPPSYPQLGFTWHIIPALEFTYFHGFLKSQIPDSIRSDTYEGIGKRSFDLARSIVGHRMEWTPFPNFTIGATESVVYGSRQIDVHYLLPFTSLWHMENHLGDMDNVQVAIDLAWIVNQNTKLHFSLYIDEWTPEWTFKENDHNWFAYQTGFIWGNLIKKLDILKFEYTWTDHRVYRHRFSINDYYSHGYPLGFWAGPHAEDYFIEYNSSFTWINFILKYTNTKRGQLTHQMLYDQYSDLSYERFSGEFGYEHRMMIELLIHHYFVNQLELQYGLEYIDWRNAGFDPFQPELNTGTDLTKWSFFCNVFYNF